MRALKTVSRGITSGDKRLCCVPLAVVAAISFLIGTIFGKDFSELSWETVFAGVLGLCGGGFALMAARWSEKQKEIKSVFGYCIKVTTRSETLILKLSELETLANQATKLPKDCYKHITQTISNLFPLEISSDAPIPLIEKHSQLTSNIEILEKLDQSGNLSDEVSGKKITIATIRTCRTQIQEIEQMCKTYLQKLDRTVE